MRAAYAKQALAYHQERTNNDSPYDDLHSAMADMLTNLRHLCKFENTSFDRAVATSLMHFEAETGL